MDFQSAVVTLLVASQPQVVDRAVVERTPVSGADVAAAAKFLADEAGVGRKGLLAPFQRVAPGGEPIKEEPKPEEPAEPAADPSTAE
jgi:hypothetical protein